MASPLTRTDKGCVVRIKLTPGASRDEILGVEEDLLGEATLKVKVRAIPEKGRANSALILLLSKSFGLPKTRFEVISGHTSRRKAVLIAGGVETETHLKKILAELDHG